MNTLSDTDEDFDINNLNPEDVRDKPSLHCDPWTLVFGDMLLFTLGPARLFLVWDAGSLEMWAWGLGGWVERG